MENILWNIQELKVKFKNEFFKIKLNIKKSIHCYTYVILIKEKNINKVMDK